MTLCKKHGLTIVIALLVVSAGLLWFACSNDKTSTPTGSENPVITVSKVAADSCKTPYEQLHGTAPNYQDCVEFAYNLQGTLLIRRFNAAFNCCPDSFGVDVDVKDGVITITESEFLTNPCDCLCLYDLDYSISGLEAGTYTIRVVEPYVEVANGDGLLQFQLDFKLTPAGQFCVYRMDYPWGMEF